METITSIGSRQIKAARAILDWSQEKLAETSGLSIATIRKLELGHISPRLSTTSALRQALENGGVEFIDPEGVRRRQEEIRTFHGKDGLKGFLDDIQQTLQRVGGDVLMVETSDISLIEWQKAGVCELFDRLLESCETSQIRCLLADLIEPPLSTPRLEFRSISTQYVDSMSFCVYGQKFAMVSTSKNRPLKIILMEAPAINQASKRQFYSMWDKTVPRPQKKDLENRRSV